MKDSALFRGLLVGTLIIVLGIGFAGLGCKKGAEEVSAPSDITIEEGKVPEEVEITEEGEVPEAVVAADEFGEQVVYVSEGGTGAGTRDDPMGVINKAIDHAQSTWPEKPSSVLVAEGTYQVLSGSTHVWISEGVSIYGGFSKDWMKRDPSVYITSIKDTSTSGGSWDSPNRAVEAGSSVTDATVIDGFKIEGSGGGATIVSAIFNHDGAKLTISNNMINGGSGSLASMAIFNFKNSPVTIKNNTIDGGNGSAHSLGVYSRENSAAKIHSNAINGGKGKYSNGIENSSGSSSIIFNNTIDAGDGIDVCHGIANLSSSPKIYNNTINGGGCSGWSHGIYNAKGTASFIGSSPLIANNIIFTSAGSDGYGIYENGTTDDAAEVKYNDFFNCPTALYHDHDQGKDFTAICPGGNFGILACGDTLNSPVGEGNVAMDPKFVGPNDWHLTNLSPTTVTKGGLDLSAEFNTDKDGDPREAPWSMGAYEYD
ncbi:MAG: right-handed parallel beta-helix repeat-containing protein [Pseudomonadota bacterium]